MLASLFGAYVGALLATYVSTVLLIVFRKNWGPVPRLYIKLIEFIQDKIGHAYIPNYNSINNNNNNNGSEVFIEKQCLSSDEKQFADMNSPFEVSNHLMISGIQSILQDDISRPFEYASNPCWTLLEPPPKDIADWKLYCLYTVGLAFRFGFLFPLRLMLLSTTIAWMLACSFVINIFPIPREIVLYLGITFARFFNASTGLVTSVYDRQYRPKAPGIAVSNHLTANDIMTIYSDCDYDGFGYTVTGQSHGGLLEPVQKWGAALTPTLWLDRANKEQRSGFQKQVLNYSSDPSVYPVLLFPEGYCTNNEVVLQFRKAVFTGQVPIFPIAFTQKARCGDAFWKEDTYLPYLIRIMTSWALQYDITYLPKMEKRDSEDACAFAGRVQTQIARTIGRDALPYDGGLKRVKDRQRYVEKVKQTILDRLLLL